MTLGSREVPFEVLVERIRAVGVPQAAAPAIAALAAQYGRSLLVDPDVQDGVRAARNARDGEWNAWMHNNGVAEDDEATSTRWSLSSKIPTKDSKDPKDWEDSEGYLGAADAKSLAAQRAGQWAGAAWVAVCELLENKQTRPTTTFHVQEGREPTMRSICELLMIEVLGAHGLARTSTSGSGAHHLSAERGKVGAPALVSAVFDLVGFDNKERGAEGVAASYKRTLREHKKRLREHGLKDELEDTRFLEPQLRKRPLPPQVVRDPRGRTGIAEVWTDQLLCGPAWIYACEGRELQRTSALVVVSDAAPLHELPETVVT